MDEKTQHLVDKFTTFLEDELIKHDQLMHYTIEHVELKEYRLSVKISSNGMHKTLYFDIREIAENEKHLSHLLASAFEQVDL